MTLRGAHVSTNDSYLLMTAVKDRLGQNPSKCEVEEFFPSFVMEEVLKDYALTADELDGALVDGGDDGGIDGILTLVNGTVVADDTDLGRFKRDVVIELHLFTSTTSRGFDLTQLDKLKTTTRKLLDLQVTDRAFARTYNAELCTGRSRFRLAIETLMSTNPTLRITYYYASSATTIHRNVQIASEELKADTTGAFSFAEVDFKFLTAGALLQLVRRKPSRTIELPFQGCTAYVEDGSYICLVKITDYYAIIADTSGWPNYRLFEDNVRDFEGTNAVNQAIMRTLEEPSPHLDFWWLNNGITMTASDAELRSGKVVLTDMSVVNGLQTSFQICHFMRSKGGADERRRIVVRIIGTDDEETRGKIIAATNNQTRIPVEALHAIEKIHRDIEEYFKSHGLYYERRRNYYRNLGQPRAKIISIRYLSQALIALVLQQPDYARARPTTLTEDATKYRRIYSSRHDLNLYLNCILVVRAVDQYMGSERDSDEYSLRTNLRWHVAAYVVGLITGQAKPSPKRISEMDRRQLTDSLVADACDRVMAVYETELDRSGTWGDVLAKSEQFTAAVYADLKEQLKQELSSAS